MYQTVRGLTIRTVDYKEADQILTILTDTRGCLTVKARGVRRKGSRLKAAAQLFTFSQMTLYEQKGRATLHDAEILQQFPGLQTDLTKLALASYFAEVLGTEAEDAPAESDILRLALNCMYALSNDLCSPMVIKAAFELRAGCLAGFQPDLSACHGCGGGEAVLFDLSEGLLLCDKCRNLISGGIRLPVSAGTLEAMRYISLCEPKRMFAFSLGAENMTQLSQISEAFLTTQLERGFSTLDFYKSLLI